MRKLRQQILLLSFRDFYVGHPSIPCDDAMGVGFIA
jgi:hypothetical protein